MPTNTTAEDAFGAQPVPDDVPRLPSLSPRSAPADTRRQAIIFIKDSQLQPGCTYDVVTRVVQAPVLDEDGQPKLDLEGKAVLRQVQHRGIEIGMVPLTMDEEITAIEGVEGSGARVAYATLQASMRSLNGRLLDFARYEQSELLNAIGPKARNVLMAGFRRISQADPEAVQAMTDLFRWS